MPQPATMEQTGSMYHGEAKATLRRLQDNATRRADDLSDQEKDAHADAAARELKDGPNARLRGQPMD